MGSAGTKLPSLSARMALHIQEVRSAFLQPISDGKDVIFQPTEDVVVVGSQQQHLSDTAAHRQRRRDMCDDICAALVNGVMASFKRDAANGDTIHQCDKEVLQRLSLLSWLTKEELFDNPRSLVERIRLHFSDVTRVMRVMFDGTYGDDDDLHLAELVGLLCCIPMATRGRTSYFIGDLSSSNRNGDSITWVLNGVMDEYVYRALQSRRDDFIAMLAQTEQRRGALEEALVSGASTGDSRNMLRFALREGIISPTWRTLGVLSDQYHDRGYFRLIETIRNEYANVVAAAAADDLPKLENDMLASIDADLSLSPTTMPDDRLVELVRSRKIVRAIYDLLGKNGLAYLCDRLGIDVVKHMPIERSVDFIESGDGSLSGWIICQGDWKSFSWIMSRGANISHLLASSWLVAPIDDDAWIVRVRAAMQQIREQQH
ncbi:MAG: hypothetical protein WC763_06495 [Candidatus Paceibacterota bacterium]|jgi:hypothetical protein